MGKKITIDEALNGKRDFFRKVWQGNNYYPIDKFVYHADTDEFELFVQKLSGWRSWGINKADGVSNKQWLRYTFERMAQILTWEEMTDDHHYDTN